MRRLVALIEGLEPAPRSALGRAQDPYAHWDQRDELLATIAEELSSIKSYIHIAGRFQKPHPKMLRFRRPWEVQPNAEEKAKPRMATPAEENAFFGWGRKAR